MRPHQANLLVTLLDQCKTLAQLHQFQAHLTTSGLLHANPTLNANLIRSLSPAPRHALRLFAHSLRPHTNTFSFVYALNSCVRSHDRNATRCLHVLSVALGHHRASLHVANATLHAYASCGDIASARALFDTIPSHDTIKYNSMISGYVRNALPGEALHTFRRMCSVGVPVTGATLVSVLSACARTSNLRLGSQVHGFVSKRASMQVETLINVATALLDMYAKCGLMASARAVFRSMETKDTAAWNALIGGYVSNQRFREALGTFDALLSSGICPDKPTLVSTLRACAHLGALAVGTRIHRYVRDVYPRLDATLGTSLVEMYAKCGCVETSRKVFGEMADRDVVAWSSMIGGLAAHGRGRDALQLFDSMRESGIRPDRVAFVGVLTACKHVGLVERGLGYFKSMSRDYGVVPRAEHFGCVIDLLSRAGRLREALELVEWMGAEANVVIWRSLLSACRCNSDVELAEVCVDSLTRLGSGHCGDYVLLSNIYAFEGMWDDARRVRMAMTEGKVRKKPAFALIESNQAGQP